MNFLIKLEDAINGLIEKLLNKIKALIPAFIIHFLHQLKHLPNTLKDLIHIIVPKIKNSLQHFFGFFGQYITLIRGNLTSVIMYVRSDEFKKTDKKELFLTPFKYARIHPIKALSVLFTFCLLIISFKVIFTNTEKIIKGTKALRAPASMASTDEGFFIELKSHKFEVKLHAAGGGHGGGSAEEHELELYLDVKIEALGENEKEILESMEEMLDDNMEAIDLPISGLPLSNEEQKKSEELMTKTLNEDFLHLGIPMPIKSIQIKQVLGARPLYFRQTERMIRIEDINLQLFLEDTHRNRQVSIDFSVLASNRNIILYLKDHQIELKDHLSTNVEPIIPQLPVEEEGRMIIKDKLKLELNEFLEKNKIEGKVLEIYIDYLMAS